MLHYLRIRDLALLDAVELDWEAGFIAVTGETGAGKSILLGALSLLAGNRADKALIRQGADSCEVEALLQCTDTGPIDACLADAGLPPCEDGRLLLSRTLARSRAAQVRINGRLATVAALQALGACWIDFHGPGEPQKLFAESWQLTLLDQYARHADALAAYATAYAGWRATLAGIAELRATGSLDPDEAAFLRGQIERIDAVVTGADAIAGLERDFLRLSRARELRELAGQLELALSGDDGLTERLGGLLAPARALAAIDAAAGDTVGRLESLIIEAADLGGEYGRLLGEAEFDDATAQSINERMEAWLALSRKYGGDVALVLERRRLMAERLDRQGDLAGSIARLEQAAAGQRRALGELAAALRARRTQAAAALAAAAAALLPQLGFRKARLRIDILPEPEPGPRGDCRCRFLIAPNAGQELQPLNQIASSGELARVMLALKAVLAQADATPVLVFDEVDANIGGETARTVGELLARLGAGRQVFCVTHLPQVAARAASHYVVSKDQDEARTTIRIEALHGDRKGRLAELARMLGDRDSATARKHAAELLG
jgi:DNA repair protein RecN (Recombination protein N)